MARIYGFFYVEVIYWMQYKHEYLLTLFILLRHTSKLNLPQNTAKRKQLDITTLQNRNNLKIGGITARTSEDSE
jgi:hypothetical protein